MGLAAWIILASYSFERLLSLLYNFQRYRRHYWRASDLPAVA